MVSKAYGATRAVDDVSFEIAPGSVHALLGENGAGKSTIVKLLSGLSLPDDGQFNVFDSKVLLSSPRAAHQCGIQTAFQELTLVKDLTVIDNMLLPYGPVGLLGTIRRRLAREMVNEHFAALDMDDIALDDEIGGLDLAVKQKIEIARAIFRKPRILLLDEPTSTLSGRDVDWLGAIIEDIKRRGVTVVFISHRLREVRAFCDSMTVLRNGKHIATGPAASFDDDAVIAMIVGRSLSHAFPPRPQPSDRTEPEVLGAEGLATFNKLSEASFSLHAGEIIGVAGLTGHGSTRPISLMLWHDGYCARNIARRWSPDRNRLARRRDPSQYRESAWVPEDRKTEALFLKLTGKQNVTLPVIDRFCGAVLIDGEAETKAVKRVFQLIDVDERALWTRVGAFSGGNQQKIAIAKWLLAESRVLLLFDPTRGIDVGTKSEIYRLIRAYADAGGAVLLYSTGNPGARASGRSRSRLLFWSNCR